MSNIPLARAQINGIVVELFRRQQYDLAELLMEAEGELHRRPPSRPKAPRQSAPVDAKMAEFLRRFARSNPHMPLQEIGQKFGVNAGRVAEALQGSR